ncbi:TetR/AcrR family transcriptional regulator [Kineococcus sp. SYSU DK006]|uniref:TetR/AcrR family transcriptional regulator n=1 Tax=Kineococcus sp. SYSU DK006 TaxID=3383127 RepID=UPI003D7D6946
MPTRILDAALTVIAEHGLHKASHARIAKAAGVSPGSLTYYFTGIDDIYACAFTRLSEGMSSQYEEDMRNARDSREAAFAVADLICGNYAGRQSIVLIFELYAYANHNTTVAKLALDWMVRSRESLARHFSPTACRAIDALVEALPMHRTFEGRTLDRDEAATAVLAIAAAFPKE